MELTRAKPVIMTRRGMQPGYVFAQYTNEKIGQNMYLHLGEYTNHVDGMTCMISLLLGNNAKLCTSRNWEANCVLLGEGRFVNENAKCTDPYNGFPYYMIAPTIKKSAEEASATDGIVVGRLVFDKNQPMLLVLSMDGKSLFTIPKTALDKQELIIGHDYSVMAAHI